MTSIELEHPVEDVQTLAVNLKETNARLSSALAAAERMATRASRLQDVTSALSQARSEAEIADVLLGRGLGVLEGERGVLARIDGKRVHVIQISGYPPDDLGLLPGSLDDPSPLTLAVTRGEPVWVQATDEELAPFPKPLRRLLCSNIAYATVAVPLRHGGEIVGALGVSFAKPTALGVADRAFTLLLAQAVADALFRARSYDAEQVARREAETRAEARADLLAAVAHDLRNPLNLIDNSAAMLAEVEGLSVDDRRKMVDMMRRSVRQMDRLIGDLLDVTRLQAGRFTLDLSTIDARDIVRSTEDMCRHDADSRGIALRTVLPERPCTLRADEGRLVQAIGNLLGNALKFTKHGGTVTVSLGAFDGEALFTVADTGPGLTPDQTNRLFNKFWQARSGDRRGIGLGLTITKGIVDAHAGRIWVHTEPGVGSAFFVAIPIRSSE
jgi:signal transduction histidine kinase